MGNVELWLILLGKAMLSLLTQPFFYVSLILVGLIYAFIIRMERSMFSTKLRPWIKPFIHSVAGGILAAIFVTLLCALLGFTLTVPTVWWLWGVSLVMSLMGLRFINIAYSASIVCLLHLIATAVGPLQLEQSTLSSIYQSLLDIEPLSLLVIAALLLLTQALLIAWQGKHMVSPIYMSGKRGKIIGGYGLQGYWAIPLLLFMPVAVGTHGAVSFAASTVQPYFLVAGPEAWLLLACPIMLGVTGMTQSDSPKQLVRQTAQQWGLYAVILLLISLVSWWIEPMLWVAAIGMLFSFELLRWLNFHNESKQPPAYAPLDQGLRVLAIVEGSPAVHMEIQVGDTVLEANGQAVNSLAELYEAMSINPAFCRLKLLNHSGEVKFAQRTRYADEHHQLGIIMAPDGNAKHLKHYREPTLITIFGKGKLRRNLTSENDSMNITL